MKKNIFNQKIPEIKELLREQEVREYIEATLLKILSYLEIKNSKELINLVIEKALNYKSLDNYEKEVHLILDGRRVNQRIPEKLSNRAEIIFEQIKPFLKGHDILDLGCGDGKVGDIISKEQPRQVILSDVYEHGNIANIKLPFTRIKKNKKIPSPENSFDTVLVLTILHHSDDPLMVLREAERVTRSGGRIIILESVYGVKSYGNLKKEQQRFVNIFFDHFYNRIIHYSNFKQNKVNIPFNFRTPEDWNILFKKEKLIVKRTVYLGFDQPVVPEYHTLHILEVK